MVHCDYSPSRGFSPCLRASVVKVFFHLRSSA
jgi:hypothetical protein